MSNRPRYITDEPKTLAEHAEVLRLFNIWRRWDRDDEDSPQMPEPRLIGKAIDAAVACMTERPPSAELIAALRADEGGK